MDFEKFIEKYSLPSKKELEDELGLLSFDEDDDIIVELIKSLRDKINKYIHFLEEMLQPDSTIISLQESSNLSESEREKLFSLFKKLLLIQRTYLLVYLDGSFDDKIIYFKQLFAGWKDLKPQLRPFVQKAVDSWNEFDSSSDKKQNYFG